LTIFTPIIGIDGNPPLVKPECPEATGENPTPILFDIYIYTII
jgi:hypothetical protein